MNVKAIPYKINIYIPLLFNQISESFFMRKHCSYFGSDFPIYSQIYTAYLSGSLIPALADNFKLPEETIVLIISTLDDFFKIEKKSIYKVMNKWGINGNLSQVYPSAWSIDNSYVIKTGQNFYYLNKNIYFMDQLEKSSLNTPVIVKTRKDEKYLSVKGKYYFITQKLPGRQPENLFQGDFVTFSFESGKYIARLHQEMQKIAMCSYITTPDLCENTKGLIDELLKSPLKELPLLKSTLEDTFADLRLIKDDLPKQIIHRDLNLGNFMYEGNFPVAILDFDLAEYNFRILDICYFLTYLLTYDDDLFINKEETLSKWIIMIDNFTKGYESIQQLSSSEKKSIPCMLKVALIQLMNFFAESLYVGELLLSVFSIIDDNEAIIS